MSRGNVSLTDLTYAYFRSYDGNGGGSDDPVMNLGRFLPAMYSKEPVMVLLGKRITDNPSSGTDNNPVSPIDPDDTIDPDARCPLRTDGNYDTLYNVYIYYVNNAYHAKLLGKWYKTNSTYEPLNEDISIEYTGKSDNSPAVVKLTINNVVLEFKFGNSDSNNDDYEYLFSQYSNMNNYNADVQSDTKTKINDNKSDLTIVDTNFYGSSDNENILTALNSEIPLTNLGNIKEGGLLIKLKEKKVGEKGGSPFIYLEVTDNYVTEEYDDTQGIYVTKNKIKGYLGTYGCPAMQIVDIEYGIENSEYYITLNYENGVSNSYIQDYSTANNKPADVEWEIDKIYAIFPKAISDSENEPDLRAMIYQKSISENGKYLYIDDINNNSDYITDYISDYKQFAVIQGNVSTYKSGKVNIYNTNYTCYRFGISSVTGDNDITMLQCNGKDPNNVVNTLIASGATIDLSSYNIDNKELFYVGNSMYFKGDTRYGDLMYMNLEGSTFYKSSSIYNLNNNLLCTLKEVDNIVSTCSSSAFKIMIDPEHPSRPVLYYNPNIKLEQYKLLEDDDNINSGSLVTNIRAGPYYLKAYNESFLPTGIKLVGNNLDKITNSTNRTIGEYINQYNYQQTVMYIQFKVINVDATENYVYFDSKATYNTPFYIMMVLDGTHYVNNDDDLIRVLMKKSLSDDYNSPNVFQGYSKITNQEHLIMSNPANASNLDSYTLDFGEENGGAVTYYDKIIIENRGSLFPANMKFEVGEVIYNNSTTTKLYIQDYEIMAVYKSGIDDPNVKVLDLNNSIMLYTNNNYGTEIIGDFETALYNFVCGLTTSPDNVFKAGESAKDLHEYNHLFIMYGVNETDEKKIFTVQYDIEYTDEITVEGDYIRYPLKIKTITTYKYDGKSFTEISCVEINASNNYYAKCYTIYKYYYYTLDIYVDVLQNKITIYNNKWYNAITNVSKINCYAIVVAK